jgi:hypothetical protein
LKGRSQASQCVSPAAARAVPISAGRGWQAHGTRTYEGNAGFLRTIAGRGEARKPGGAISPSPGCRHPLEAAWPHRLGRSSEAMLLALTPDEKRCELVHKARCRAARDSGCAPNPQKPPVFWVFGGVGVGLGWICGLVCGRVLFSESPPLMRKVCGQPPSSNGLENGSLLGVPVRVGLIFRSWLSRKR